MSRHCKFKRHWFFDLCSMDLIVAQSASSLKPGAAPRILLKSQIGVPQLAKKLKQVMKKEYTEIHVGGVIRFGMSTHLYEFQGPSGVMPPVGDLNKIREAKAARDERWDREESLARAKSEASLAEGISWGMGEDAIEEDPEVDVDEITWQTYKGQLTQWQEKTKSKIVKRIEKVAHIKKEIDAIRAKKYKPRWANSRSTNSNCKK